MTKIGIIGGGPAGIMTAIFASQNPHNEVYIIDKGIILNTILPTGGGRCNLAYAEYNFKELAKFYPRGEKFLYGIFSRFSTSDTLEFFENIGIKTYIQEDNRIFPISNSAKDVKNALIQKIEKTKNIRKLFENVNNISFKDDKFFVETNKNSHIFDKLVIATGGKGNGHKLVKKLGHNIVELKPALSSLITKEKNYTNLSGISLKDITADVFFDDKKIQTLSGDFIFTHKGISGPIVYKISSYCAYIDFSHNKPLKMSFNLVQKSFEDFDKELSEKLKQNAQKEVLNVVSDYLPKNLCIEILKNEKINSKIKAGQITKIDREKFSKKVTDFVFNAIEITKGEEIVTAGGVDLKEINPKTLESKIIPNLYFCGEIMDIDGLTGGFNLQNCWSTGFVVGSYLNS